MMKDCRAAVKREECSFKGCEERRVRGQRYCRKHKNAAQQEYRERKKEKFRKLIVDRIRLVALEIRQLNERGGAGTLE